jgi:superfamily II DNA or RNA helicase
MIDKTTRQKQGAERWRWNKGKGGFIHPTGFGKMYETINFIIMPMLEKDPNSEFIIVVNSDNLRQQWKAQLKKFLKTDKFPVLVETINFFQIQRLKYSTKLLILDEMSMYFSDDRQNIWNGEWVQFNFLLWLDATPIDYQRRDSIFYATYPPVDTISRVEALKNNWITSAITFNLAVDLTAEEREKYQKAEQLIDDNFPKFSMRFDEVMACVEGKVLATDSGLISYTPIEYCELIAQRYGYKAEFKSWIKNGFPETMSKGNKQMVWDICKMWTPEKVMGYALNVMKGVRIRKEIIYKGNNKYQLIIDILKYMNEKAIIFSQRTEVASKIAILLNSMNIPAVEYHSKVVSRSLRELNGEPTLIGGVDQIVYKSGKRKGEPMIFGAKTLKDLAIKQITNNTAKVLCTGSALDRGLDIPDLALSITAGFTSNPSQSDQRQGRLTRIDATNLNKLAVYVNLYLRETKEQDYLEKAQANFNKESIYWITRVDQISRSPVKEEEQYEDI